MSVIKFDKRKGTEGLLKLTKLGVATLIFGDILITAPTNLEKLLQSPNIGDARVQRLGRQSWSGFLLFPFLPPFLFPSLRYFSVRPFPHFLSFPFHSFLSLYFPSPDPAMAGAVSSPSEVLGGVPAAKAFLVYFEPRICSGGNDFVFLCTYRLTLITRTPTGCLHTPVVILFLIGFMLALGWILPGPDYPMCTVCTCT